MRNDTCHLKQKGLLCQSLKTGGRRWFCYKWSLPKFSFVYLFVKSSGGPYLSGNVAVEEVNRCISTAVAQEAIPRTKIRFKISSVLHRTRLRCINLNYKKITIIKFSRSEQK